MTDEASLRYRVLVNDEHQYALWLDHLSTPNGWCEATENGRIVRGVAEDCKKFVDRIWTDMRPMSLRGMIASDEQQMTTSNDEP